MPAWLIPILASMASTGVAAAAAPKTSSSSPGQDELNLGQQAAASQAMPLQSQQQMSPSQNPNYFLPSPWASGDNQQLLAKLQQLGFS